MEDAKELHDISEYCYTYRGITAGLKYIGVGACFLTTVIILSVIIKNN